METKVNNTIYVDLKLKSIIHASYCLEKKKKKQRLKVIFLSYIYSMYGPLTMLIGEDLVEPSRLPKLSRISLRDR